MLRGANTESLESARVYRGPPDASARGSRPAWRAEAPWPLEWPRQGQEGGPVELRPVPSGGCHRREGLRAERARVHVVMRGIVDGREAPETLTESTGQVTRLSGGGAPRAGPTASLHGDSSARVKAGGLAEKPRALRAGAALLAPRMSSGSRGRLRKLLWGTPPSRSRVDAGEAPGGDCARGARRDRGISQAAPGFPTF